MELFGLRRGRCLPLKLFNARWWRSLLLQLLWFALQSARPARSAARTSLSAARTALSLACVATLTRATPIPTRITALLALLATALAFLRREFLTATGAALREFDRVSACLLRIRANGQGKR